MCYKKKKSLLFDVVKNGQILPSKVFQFQYDHRLLFSRELGNIRSCKELRVEELIKFMLLR